MNGNVESDMKWSSKLFVTQVWPLCQKACGGGELMRMEGRPDVELAQTLDMMAGIDGWQLHADGMRGIASRVQAGEKDWSTFTIRMKRDSGATTEFEKRLIAINGERGWIYPHLTIQAYAKTQDGPIISVGIALTKDLIDYIQKNHAYEKRTDNATFAVCSWDRMQKLGYGLKILKPQEDCE